MHIFSTYISFNIANIILLILLLYYNVDTMAEIDLHLNRSTASHLNTYKVRFFVILVPETCHIDILTDIIDLINQNKFCSFF